MKFNQAQAQRGKLLNVARAMARSGQHENHRSIVAALQPLDSPADAHRCLTYRVISAQLDRALRSGSNVCTGCRPLASCVPGAL